MVFENNLQSDPSPRDQLVRHIPIALIVLGVLAAFVALHTAVTGVLLLGLGHAVVGLVILGIRRHRANAVTS